eukprot:TRINITY_DN98158_c0_g1_i1.p1 TRINITY_DN98158_c0_g1~~TRINITY_DN98158_c0_g1_i1.p1  ORF type:complete len:106 (-),score=12.69 TRINITY_DN98158_c0_g1_i1:116-433(-)
MPRMQVLTPLMSRFLCMCTGYGAPVETPADKQLPADKGLPQVRGTGRTLLQNSQRSAREVHIDKSTSVPVELYWDLVRAGERAKERGQHQLKDKRHSRKHLVMSF